MGAAGGAGGSMKEGAALYDPSMTGRGFVNRGSASVDEWDKDPYIIAAYKDETRNGYDSATKQHNVYQNAIMMRQSDYDSRKNDILSNAQNYGWAGVQDLVKSNVAKYYDVTKNLLANSKNFYDQYGKALTPELDGVMKELPTDWTGDGKLFNSYSAAVGIHKTELGTKGSEAPTTGGTPSTGGTGGEVGDGSLLTSADKEKKRLQGLSPTSGALTLGSTSLLGS